MSSPNKATGAGEAPSGLGSANSEPNVAASGIGDHDRVEKIEVEKSVDTKKQTKKRKWKKPKDMPKRPLSAYNLFFAHERQEMIKKGALQKPFSDDDLVGGSSPTTQKRKMGFAGLARSVAKKWKELDPVLRAPYEEQAAKEQSRYKKEMEEWKRTQEERKTLDQQLQYAATTGIQASSAAALAHFQGTAGLSSALHPMMSVRDLTSGRGSYTGVSSTMPPSSGLAMWPAMPQTIASLGNIYDDSMEMSSSSATPATSFDPHSSMSSQMGAFTGAGSASDILSANPGAALRTSHHYDRPLDQLMLTPPEVQRQMLGNVTFDSAVLPFLGSQQMQQQFQQQSMGGGNPQGLNVASPDRINTLASQLDDETFAFLSSLGQNNNNSNNNNNGFNDFSYQGGNNF